MQLESGGREENIGKSIQVVVHKVACGRVKRNNMSCTADDRIQRRPVSWRLCRRHAHQDCARLATAGPIDARVIDVDIFEAIQNRRRQVTGLGRKRDKLPRVPNARTFAQRVRWRRIISG